MKANNDIRRRRRRILIAAASVVAVGVIGFAAFAIWYLRDDAPDAVSIDAAVEQITGTSTDPSITESTAHVASTAATASTDAAQPSESAAIVTGITGTWNVDTSIGEFSYEDSTGTFVGFRIDEELSGIGSTEAVGRTPSVTGTLVADGTTITEVTIEADMTAITTNDGRRDDNVQDALETNEYPMATFMLTEPIELGDAAMDGEPLSVQAVGDLTIHGVTRTITIPLQAQLVGDTIAVVGSLEIVFADYGVEVPSARVVISVEDHGDLELQLFFTRSS